MIMKRTIIITGATSGIGELAARTLATEGTTLVLTGRNNNKLWELKKELSSQCDKVKIRPAKFDEILSLKSFSVKETKDATIIINSAADFGPTNTFSNITSEDMLRAYQVNVVAPLLLAQKALPYMIENKYGRIINIGSSAGLTGYPLRMPYCASKHALVGLTKTLNGEFATNPETKSLDIRAYCLCPGPVKGQRLQKQVIDRAICKATTVEKLMPKFEVVDGGILDPQIVVDEILLLLEPGVENTTDIVTFTEREYDYAN